MWRDLVKLLMNCVFHQTHTIYLLCVFCQLVTCFGTKTINKPGANNSDLMNLDDIAAFGAKPRF